MSIDGTNGIGKPISRVDGTAKVTEFEIARFAATLVKIDYEAEEVVTDKACLNCG